MNTDPLTQALNGLLTHHSLAVEFIIAPILFAICIYNGTYSLHIANGASTSGDPSDKALRIVCALSTGLFFGFIAVIASLITSSGTHIVIRVLCFTIQIELSNFISQAMIRLMHGKSRRDFRKGV